MNPTTYKFNTSTELYVLDPGYKGVHAIKLADRLLRLVSGIDGNPTPGYHYRPGWTAVTIDDEPIELHGIEQKYLQRIF